MLFSRENRHMFWETLIGCAIAALVVALVALIVASFSTGFFAAASWLVAGQWLLGAFCTFTALAILGCSEFFGMFLFVPTMIVFGALVGESEEVC